MCLRPRASKHKVWLSGHKPSFRGGVPQDAAVQESARPCGVEFLSR